MREQSPEDCAPSAAAPPRSFLDTLLDKDILPQLLRHLPTHSSLRLSETCTALCHQVRAALPVFISLQGEQGRELCCVPKRRTFAGATRLAYAPQDHHSSFLALTAAVRHAACYWPNLNRVSIELGKLPRNRYSHADEDDLVLLGPLTILQLAPKLNTLHLSPISCSWEAIEALSALTGLTRLVLSVADDADDTQLVNFSPLTALTNLVELEVSGLAPDFEEDADSRSKSTSAPGGVAVSACLPSSLTRLELLWGADAENWVQQLVHCTALRELSIQYIDRSYSWRLHPCAVQWAVGPKLQQLTRLTFNTSEEWLEWHDDEDDLVGQLSGVPELVEEYAGEMVSLGPHLRHFCSLQAFATEDNLLLRVEEEDDWTSLSACPALKQLGCLGAAVLPPAGMRPLQLTQLELWMDGSYEEVIGVLRYCPELKQLQLAVMDGASLPQEWSEATAVATRSACSRLEQLQLEMDTQDIGTCEEVLGLFPQLPALDLRWPCEVSGSLPSLTALSALTRLALHASGAEADSVRPEDLMMALKGCSQLVSLEVSGLAGVTPRLALMLQHELPRLQQLTLVRCGALETGSSGRSTPSGSSSSRPRAHDLQERERLERLRLLLRPGLKLSVAQNWAQLQLKDSWSEGGSETGASSEAGAAAVSGVGGLQGMGGADEL